ncbi:MAG: D-glycero-beta-D-manno-heptose 1-phosphate adenylyltransferase [Acidobacteria bacterium]|nr:D-glycero-beta-D-manno-heptose 1-phosphate adenylyltransferase [Acidobacteriota bacterium]
MTIKKLVTLDDALRIRRQFREEGKKLVFTNGCFDILHVGHVRYLYEARQLGDALMVAVNSDRSVCEIKGEGRPFVPESERAEILCALGCIDYVLIFDEPTPQSIIEAILPDVLVKGADWGPMEIVGRETVENAGGLVLSIALVPGVSTSAIVSRIVERFGKPAGLGGLGQPAPGV